VGAVQASRFLLGLFRRVDRFQVAHAELALVNGDLGLVVDGIDAAGAPSLTVIGLAVADGRITAVYNQLNPDKLREVPRPDPARASWPPQF
jgi:RNA polymerase sigma-70 factor (ECF subfamily)